MSNQIENFFLALNQNFYKIIGLGALAAASLIYLKAYGLYTKSNYHSTIKLTDKIAIVTGANTGIGYEIALDLAKRGARVIMACRDSNKANNAANRIKQITGSQNVFVEIVDLASFDSVKRFFQNFILKHKNVNILINNAGSRYY
jgi:predicted amino acid dehydrogenase